MDVNQKAVFTIFDTETHSKQYYQNNSQNFGAFEINRFERLIFISEFAPNPKIFVLDFDLNEMQTIENVCSLEIDELYFDHFNKFLFIFCKCEEFQIKVFDYEKEQLITIENQIDTQEPILKFELNPFNSNECIILRKNQLEFHVFQKMFEYNKENQNFSPILHNEVFIINFEELLQDIEEEGQFTDFIWIKNNSIYISTSGGSFINYDLQKKEKKSFKQIGYSIDQILINQKNIFLLVENRQLQIYELNENLEINSLEQSSEINFDEDYIEKIMFTEHFDNFILTTANNAIYRAILPQDKDEESEDIKEEENQNNTVVMEIDFQLIGCFHQSKIILLHHFQQSNIFVSLDQQGFLYAWNIFSEFPEKFVKIGNQKILSACVDEENWLIFIGCENGVFKVFKLNSELNLEKIFQIKYFINQNIDQISLSKCGSFLSLRNSQEIILIKNSYKENFPVFGMLKTQKKILDQFWHQKQRKIALVVLIEKGFVLDFVFNQEEFLVNQKLQQFPENVYQNYIKRIDPDIQKITKSEEENYFYCIGEDLVVKTYLYPNQLIKHFDFSERISEIPENEQILISLPCNFFKYDNQFLIFGTIDSEFSFYDIGKKQLKTISLMKAKNGGISFVSFSKKYELFFLGGFEGCIHIIKTNEFLLDENLPKIEKQQEIILKEQVKDELEEKILNYEELQKEKFEEKIKEEKEKIQQQILKELKRLQKQFQKLQEENKNQEKLKQLNYEEFCIDLEEKQKIEKETVQEIKNIKEEAKRNISMNDLIHQKLKKLIFDKMKVHLKTLTGFEKKALILNFSIPHKEPDEIKYYQKIKFLRRLEVKEKNWILEEDPKDTSFWSAKRIMDENCNFLVNGKSEKPELILIDYEAREQAIKDYLEEQRKKIENMNNNNNTLRAKQKKYEIKNRREKKAKRHNANNAMRTIEKRTNYIKQNTAGFHSLENIDGESEWKFFYPQVEVFSRFKKVNQIYFARNMIELIKKEFNTKFEDLLKNREKQMDLIFENNKKIKEIFLELGKEEEIFQLFPNIIEKVENVLQIQDKEIQIKKYLTEKEKNKIEEEKRKEEEKLKAINSDDCNIRALKMMMNNTLEEAKENILKKEIEKEDWMDKPKEEMNEQERAKYSEYLEKQEQLKIEAEKLRKIYNQELKKLKVNTKEIVNEFDHKVSILFMMRLEYQYRVFEQELIILQLKKCLYRDQLFEEKFQETKKEIKEKEKDIENKKFFLEMLQKQINEMSSVKNEKELDFAKQDNKMMRQILQLILPQKEEFKKKKNVDKEFLDRICQIKKIRFLYQLDPYLESIEKFLTKKYELDREVHQNLVEEMLKKKLDQGDVQNECQKFFKYLQTKKEFEIFIQEQEDQGEMCEKLSSNLQQKNQKLEELQKLLKTKEKEFQKSKKNVYLMIRLPNEKIEIQTMKVIPLLSDIIVIDQRQVEELNGQITSNGKQKLDYLRKNLDEKQKVDSDLLEQKILKKEIKEALIESSILTRLKVSKRLQVALNNKNENLIDLEEKNAKKQIDKINQTTEKNLQTFQKKEQTMKKEIKYLSLENDNLLLQGGTLEESVKQRSEIFTMIFNKDSKNIFQEENQENLKKKGEYKKDEVGYQKAMELAKNRKLFDVAKQLAHEIENLMVELKQLKERTYPNLGQQSKFDIKLNFQIVKKVIKYFKIQN